MNRKGAKTQRRAQRKLKAAFGGNRSGEAAFAKSLRLCAFAVNQPLVTDTSS
jgi:hypothetical protein